MITSLLRFPKGDRYIQIHQSLLAACDGNACAAALVKFFERWHRYKLQQKEYTSLYNAMAREAGLEPVIDISGWQYHTYEQLKQGVLIYSEDAIRSALRLLEQKEFVSSDVPEHLKMLHKTGRTQWFLLRAERLNEWLDKYELSIRPKQLVFPPRKAETAPAPEKAIPTGDDAELALKVFRYKSDRRIEFWKARGKQMREAVPDADTLYVIMKLLDKFKPEELAYAIEGNLASVYHQGDNPTKAVYDDVRKILKDAASVNKFIGYAEQNGVLFKDVVKRFRNGSGAPAPVMETDAQSRADYYTRLTAVLVKYVITDKLGAVACEQLKPELAAVWNEAIPFNAELLEERMRGVIERAVGIYSTNHQSNFRVALRVIEELAQ